jgi:hypothetical protein
LTDISFSLASLDDLSFDELSTAERLLAQLDARTVSNQKKEAYYEGTQRVRDLGLSIPPELKNVETVVGWPRTAVDVLEHRIEIEGFEVPGGSTADLGIDEIVEENDLLVEASTAHLDALIFGVAFIAVGTGMDGEPDPLVTVESPRHMTAFYDLRARRVSAALSRVWDPERGRSSSFTLYLPDQTIRARRSVLVNGWIVEDRDQHGLGEVTVARLVNRRRASDPYGRSQITRAIRAYTDNAVRTMLGMEVNREFYSSPQRWVMGADDRAFVGPDGQPKTAWESYLGRFLALTADESGTLPQVGQFAASSPAPYIEIVKMLAGMVSTETGIPATRFGFISDNPPSADSTRVLESTLIKNAERCQAEFGRNGWADAIRKAVLVRDGVVPAPLRKLKASWRDAATPTRSAAADEVMKYVTAGVLPAHSEVTWKRAGFTPDEIAQLKIDVEKVGGMEALLRQVADVDG